MFFLSHPSADVSLAASCTASLVTVTVRLVCDCDTTLWRVTTSARLLRILSMFDFSLCSRLFIFTLSSFEANFLSAGEDEDGAKRWCPVLLHPPAAADLSCCSFFSADFIATFDESGERVRRSRNDLVFCRCLFTVVPTASYSVFSSVARPCS